MKSEYRQFLVTIQAKFAHSELVRMDTYDTWYSKPVQCTKTSIESCLTYFFFSFKLLIRRKTSTSKVIW